MDRHRGEVLVSRRSKDRLSPAAMGRSVDEEGEPVAGELERGERGGVIRLEGALEIARAGELKQRLLEALSQGGTLRISLGEVTDLDVTAVQLLYAAEREAKLRGVDVAVEEPVSEPVCEALLAVGFERVPFAVSGDRVGE